MFKGYFLTPKDIKPQWWQRFVRGEGEGWTHFFMLAAQNGFLRSSAKLTLSVNWQKNFRVTSALSCIVHGLRLDRCLQVFN